MGGTYRSCELPEVILHKILSYLPIRDVVRTSVLSKWWKNAWDTLPYLNFNHKSFGKPICWQGTEMKAVQRIVRSRQHINNIEKFCLCVFPWNDDHRLPPQNEDDKKIRREISLKNLSFINSVATLILREFKLVNGIPKCKNFLILPSTLLSAKRLTSLTLIGFDLSSSWSSIDIKFTCLQKLDLQFVELDDNVLENLIIGSVSSLETLILMVCIGLRIVNLGRGFVN